MNRKEAIFTGSPRYDGRPCAEGHGTLRYTTSSKCVECARLAVHAKREARREAGIKRPGVKSEKETRAERISAIIELLRFGPREQSDIAASIGIATTTCNRLLEKLIYAKKIHIKKWVRKTAQPARMLALGPGKNAPKPAPLTKAQIWKRYKTKFDKIMEGDAEEMLVKEQRERHRATMYQGNNKPRKAHRDPLTAALFGSAK